jgi:hypothetical protein
VLFCFYVAAGQKLLIYEKTDVSLHSGAHSVYFRAIRDDRAFQPDGRAAAHDDDRRPDAVQL